MYGCVGNNRSATYQHFKKPFFNDVLNVRETSHVNQSCRLLPLVSFAKLKFCEKMVSPITMGVLRRQFYMAFS